MLINSNGSAAVPAVMFWGAAQSVTGSMHLLEAGDQRILLDCGSTRRVSGVSLPGFPISPEQIDAVVLSHAHSDHCGNLPRLVHEGFTGPIYCTAATRDLIALMLDQSARFREEDARVLVVLGRAAEPVERAPFTRSDVEQVIAQCVVVPYDQPQPIGDGIVLHFADAGHILGSAIVHLVLTRAGREFRLTFTGDLGRRGMPLLQPPAPLPPADLLICECTYGGRTHPPVEELGESLCTVVQRTLERAGRVLIPAFSLGRTQSVVQVLQEAIDSGRLPPVPVFADSPLAADIADVYRAYAQDLQPGSQPLGGQHVRYVDSQDESIELSTRREPCVVIAAGGMCEGGRILRHLKHHIDDPRCTVALVSYQAPHTTGRRLLERGPTVRFHGHRWNKWAEIVELPGFSGHADQAEMLSMLRPLAKSTRRVCLVHGELDAARALAKGMRKLGFADVMIPAAGESVAVA